MTCRQTSVISCHLRCFSWRSAALCLAIRHWVLWLLRDRFILELMCLDSELISACTCDTFTEHVHTHVPKIWQHPDQRARERERPANDHWLDWSVCACVWESLQCDEDQDSRGGSQAENRTAWTSSYPRGLWGPTPARLPHVRGMRRLKSVVQAHVCLNRTQLQPVCVYVCVCARNGRTVSNEVLPSPQRPATCVPVSCVCMRVMKSIMGVLPL